MSEIIDLKSDIEAINVGERINISYIAKDGSAKLAFVEALERLYTIDTENEDGSEPNYIAKSYTDEVVAYIETLLDGAADIKYRIFY